MQQLLGSRGQVRWQGNAKGTNKQEATQLGSQTSSSSRGRQCRYRWGGSLACLTNIEMEAVRGLVSGGRCGRRGQWADGLGLYVGGVLLQGCHRGGGPRDWPFDGVVKICDVL